MLTRRQRRSRPPSRLCWLLLFIYLALVAGFWRLLFTAHEWNYWLLIGLTLGTQVLFLVIRGDPRLLEPIRRRQLFLPALIGGLMAAVLFGGLVAAASELFRLEDSDWLTTITECVVLLSWALWTMLFYTCSCHLDYFRALRRIVLWLIAGSVLQLLATVPSHLIVSRRPGCFVGIVTGMGMLAGLAVLLWAFGPGIILLFMYETRRRLKGHCRTCGYDLTGNVSGICPECGSPCCDPAATDSSVDESSPTCQVHQSV